MVVQNTAGRHGLLEIDLIENRFARSLSLNMAEFRKRYSMRVLIVEKFTAVGDGTRPLSVSGATIMGAPNCGEGIALAECESPLCSEFCDRTCASSKMSA